MILISHSMKSVLLIQLILSKDKRLQIYFDKDQFVSSSPLLPQPVLLSLRCSPGRRRSPHPVLGVGGRHLSVPGTGHQAPPSLSLEDARSRQHSGTIQLGSVSTRQSLVYRDTCSSFTLRPAQPRTRNRLK